MKIVTVQFSFSKCGWATIASLIESHPIARLVPLAMLSYVESRQFKDCPNEQ